MIKNIVEKTGCSADWLLMGKGEAFPDEEKEKREAEKLISQIRPGEKFSDKELELIQKLIKILDTSPFNSPEIKLISDLIDFVQSKIKEG